MISKIKQEITKMKIQTMAKISREYISRGGIIKLSIPDHLCITFLVVCVLKCCGKPLKSLYSTFRLLQFNRNNVLVISVF